MTGSAFFRLAGLMAALGFPRAWTSAIFAADGPVIRSSSVQIRSDQKIAFQFEADVGRGAADFQVQVATELGLPAVWRTETQASISEIIQGLYHVVVPVAAERNAYFYRVLVQSIPMAPLYINEVMTRNDSKIADSEGRYWDWIEIYNAGDSAVDLNGYGLSDDVTRLRRWRFPKMFIQPGAFVLVFASNLNLSEAGKDLHASFRLDARGEQFFLAAPDGRIVDKFEIPVLGTDQSAGRFPDGSEPWRVYGKEMATPGAANFIVSLGPVIRPPHFTINEQFFPAGTTLTLRLKPTAPGQTIRYTTDGSPVIATSQTNNSPIILNKTTVVRAVAFEGERASAETVRTFFLGATHNLPVISLATQPSHFEFRNGFLYGMSSRVISSTGQVLQNFPFSGSNAWLDREAEVSIEFYEPNRQLGFQQRAGLKIFGGWGSRGYSQKSFALFARQKYGAGKINYRIFPDKPIEDFEALVLRNSGNDNQSTHQTAPRPPITAFGAAPSYGSYFVNSSFTLMRDAMMQRLVKETGLDTQAYRPAVLYINGDYWGIYNIREKMNEHYVASNHGLDKGKIDLIEGYGSVMAGDNVVNQAMRTFFASRDLKVSTNYAFVAENYIDVDNFIDYHLTVIYFQNFDIGNIKSWRPRTAKGLFRWMLYDQDYGFNLWKPEVYLPAMKRDYADYDNMFKFYTAGSGTGTGWPNEGGRTLLLRRMLLNDSFKERFIKRCADLLNGPFREERVVQTIQEMAAVIRPEIPRHLQRWNWASLQQRGFDRPHQREYEPFTQETWEKNIQVLIDFAQKRPAKLRQDCANHFGLPRGMAELTLNITPPGSGEVQLNSLALTNSVWTGVYFRDYPVAATATPRPGYRFAGWTGSTAQEQPKLELTLGQATANLTARFERAESVATGLR